MTIGTLVCLLHPATKLNPGVQNGSITLLEYENGQFEVKTIGDISYREVGEKILESNYK